ncbi:MAG: iron ABC transporter permease [Ilumatobacteraceae bacterium]
MHSWAGPRSWPRHVVVALTVALFLAPGLFVVWRALRLGASIGDTLGELRGPAWRSAQLAVLVSVTAALLGTLLAWLITCTDLPGRRIWSVVLVFPLALPSFVGTTGVLAGFTPGGVLASLWELFGATPPRRIRGLLPAWLLLSAFSYPFVLLPVAARLRTLRRAFDDSARMLGASSFEIFVRITLPQVRSAITGGTLIVALYMLSEFGAVQLLGFDTLTRVIYATRQVDRPTSFMAAAILFVSSIAVVTLVRSTQGQVATETSASSRAGEPVRLGRLTPVALIPCVVAVAVGVVAPLWSLITLAQRGVSDGRVALDGLTDPLINTGSMAVTSALITLAVVLPIAISGVRHRDITGRIGAIAVVAGFALPAIVIALAIAVLTLNTPLLDRLYQTLPLLVIAYVVHFGSQALGCVEQGVRSVSTSLLDSATLLEPSRWRRMLHIELPLMRHGLFAGGGLVMLAVIKELPATLLLAPIGFRTLSTEVWASFEEGFLADAAVASLALLLVSGALTWLLVLRESPSRGR